MPSRRPDNSSARPRGPRFVSIPIHTLARAQQMPPQSFLRETLQSVKAACKIAGDAKSNEVGFAEVASTNPPDSSRGSHGTVIQIPLPTSGARMSALEIVNLLYSDPSTCSYDLSGAAFHLSCPVEWLCPNGKEKDLDLAWKEERGELWPNMVWQPYFEGEYCRPDYLEAIKDLCKRFAIFAPNHIDLLAMCSKTSAFEKRLSSFTKRTQRLYNGRKIIEECARDFLDSGIGANGLGYMIVKAGEFGCLVASLAFGDTFTWLAALREGQDAPTDPREGTTEFVGAVSFVTFVQKHNIIRAGKLSMVAASFASDDRVGDANAFETRMDAYSDVQRAESRRFQIPRDLDDPSAYTSDENDGNN